MILSSGAITSWNEGARVPSIGQPAVDFVGDDPEVFAAGDVERGGDFLARRDEAGRIGRRIEHDRARRRRDRRRQRARVEAPALRRGRAGHGTARAPAVSIAPTKFGQAGEGISASSPGPQGSRIAISMACMPPMVTKKRSGRKVAAARRCAIDAGHVVARSPRASPGCRLRRCRRSRRGRASALAASTMKSGVGRSPSPTQSGIRPCRPRP